LQRLDLPTTGAFMSNLIQSFTRNPAAITQRQPAESQSHESKVIDYYSSATAGYQDWSRNINMHFGYYQWGMNPFDLETMLENTNRRVFDLLQLQGEGKHLLDMGCGVGATARFCAGQEGVVSVTGITLADSQIREAQELSRDLSFTARLNFQKANYHHTPCAGQSFDGIYAIESACHSAERDKVSLLKEAHRLLKPGGRLVICDGFIKSPKRLNPFSQFCYRKTCEHWALGHFPEEEGVVAAMEKLGYKNIQVQDITLRIMPSAAFVRYFCKLLWTRDKNPQHWHHLLAPVWGFLLGLNLRRFRYCLVSGEK
jgi:MPBQ/MSBQ methyltransferase